MLSEIQAILPIGSQEFGAELHIWERTPENQDTYNRYYGEFVGKGHVIRLVFWDTDPLTKVENRMIVDVKEEPIEIPKISAPSEFFEAFKNVLLNVLSKKDSRRLIPSDLMNERIWGASQLKRPKTVVDFEKALLAKNRLGKYL